MGGHCGGGLNTHDISVLERKAKESIEKARESSSKHVFISFSHEDRVEVNLLRGQAKNDNSNLEFDDYSLKEPFDSDNADYIKEGIQGKIGKCSVTVVYLSGNTASSQWVNWEIEESVRCGKGVIGVYQGDNAPKNLPPAFVENNCKVVKWEHEALMQAINDASITRK